jgi:hypothetical protein
MVFCHHCWSCVQSMAVSTVRSGQSGVYSGIAGGHRAIVLRPHGREGLYTCQAVSLGTTREPGRFPGSDHLRGVFFRRPRGTECRKTSTRGDKRTEIIRMAYSTPKMAPQRAYLACPPNGRILLANPLQSSRSTFSRESFPSCFAFKEGMWGTQISALLSSPTVSAR